ncbi:hypothetical protein [Brevundimonas sp.]|uniref:hypothetical protein n=1 Tax=Brevundimonas sp. TaxID=1871086 RepID=UPI001A2639EB|nr:hypothetical protein [Brevundimonas sp.]MBJ7485814.1 hypothetical protein [Brevundimonas sp.]
MPTTRESIVAQIDSELSRLTDDNAKQAVLHRRVDPRPITLDWEYGTAGQQFDGWVVFDHEAESDTLIVYCEHGFGPTFPWGLVFASAQDGRRSMGMDSGWFSSFMDAFWDSHAATSLTRSRLSESL